MIKLFDNWVVLVDDLNYTLAKIKGRRIDSKTGKERTDYKIYGYYRDLASALKALSEELVREKLKGGVADLTEAVRTIRESNGRVEDLLREALQNE